MPADEKDPFSTMCQMLPIGDIPDKARGDTQGPWWCYHSHGCAVGHDPKIPDPNPIPSQTSSLGPGSGFNLQDLASASLGPYLHIFQELCWLPIPPHALGPAQTMLQPGRGFGECQPPRSGLGLSPARISPANELLHINTFISYLIMRQLHFRGLLEQCTASDY